MDQLDLSVGQGEHRPINECLYGRKLINVDHLRIPAQVHRVQSLLNKSLTDEAGVSLVQLDLHNRAKDPEQILRQVLTLRHSILFDHHVL